MEIEITVNMHISCYFLNFFYEKRDKSALSLVEYRNMFYLNIVPKYCANILLTPEVRRYKCDV